MILNGTNTTGSAVAGPTPAQKLVAEVPETYLRLAGALYAGFMAFEGSRGSSRNMRLASALGGAAVGGYAPILSALVVTWFAASKRKAKRASEEE